MIRFKLRAGAAGGKQGRCACERGGQAAKPAGCRDNFSDRVHRRRQTGYVQEPLTCQAQTRPGQAKAARPSGRQCRKWSAAEQSRSQCRKAMRELAA
nr:MAG TPA: hypothetical protein [Caudoviricetes sp.]